MRVQEESAKGMFEVKYMGLGLLLRDPSVAGAAPVEHLRIVTGVRWSEELVRGGGWCVVTGTLVHVCDLLDNDIVDTIAPTPQPPSDDRLIAVTKLSTMLHAYNRR